MLIQKCARRGWHVLEVCSLLIVVLIVGRGSMPPLERGFVLAKGAYKGGIAQGEMKKVNHVLFPLRENTVRMVGVRTVQYHANRGSIVWGGVIRLLTVRCPRGRTATAGQRRPRRAPFALWGLTVLDGGPLRSPVKR